MQNLIWGLPTPIQVLSTQWAPIVAIYHAIWIEYWHDFKDEVVSQRSSLRSVTGEKIKDALHHPRGIALSWVHPGA